jgi:hypothetical protein
MTVDGGRAALLQRYAGCLARRIRRNGLFLALRGEPFVRRRGGLVQLRAIERARCG